MLDNIWLSKFHHISNNSTKNQIKLIIYLWGTHKGNGLPALKISTFQIIEVLVRTFTDSSLHLNNGSVEDTLAVLMGHWVKKMLEKSLMAWLVALSWANIQSHLQRGRATGLEVLEVVDLILNRLIMILQCLKPIRLDWVLILMETRAMIKFYLDQTVLNNLVFTIRQIKAQLTKASIIGNNSHLNSNTSSSNNNHRFSPLVKWVL
jgi:hypothetical protein